MSSIHSGSPLSAEMARTTFSSMPFFAASPAASESCQPYSYSPNWLMISSSCLILSSLTRDRPATYWLISTSAAAPPVCPGDCGVISSVTARCLLHTNCFHPQH